MNSEAERLYKSFLNKKQEVHRRKTERAKSFLKMEALHPGSDQEDFREAEEHDEHELSEAAQITCSALYSIVCKLSEEADDVGDEH